MNLEPICVPGKPDNLSQLLDYVTWAAAGFGLDDAAAYRLSLAVDEIATNIVMHDYEGAESAGDLTLWAESDDDRLTIYLEDTGKPFDPRQVPQPADLDRPLEERRDGGLGIFLALWGVDEFFYERIGATNRCGFVMYRPDDRGGRGLSGQDRPMTTAYIHILVIDDDEAQSDRMTRPFSSWGWDATRVGSDPKAALARLADGGFDLVLLDLAAAEHGDYAFLRGRRRNPMSSAVPVVVTATPDASPAQLARCIERGAGDYSLHPHHHVLLRARLQNVLQRKLLQEQATTALEAFNEIEKIADDLRLVILPIGAALSGEAEFDRLIARIVAEAQSICNADAGVLYLAREDGMLHHVYVRIQSLDFTYQELPGGVALFAPMPLADPETGEPNDADLPVYVALTGESVNLTDMNGDRFDLELPASLESETEFRAESCLAVPLRSGAIVGSLLLADSRHPLTGEIISFDAYHQQVAESLASQAAVVLNNRLLNERQSQLMRFKRELEIGREIQLSFLPARLPSPPGWELAAHFQPALEVAGDFYDAFLLPHGYLALVIADVVGKGVTAALFMAIIRSLFRALFQQNYFEAEPIPAAPDAGRMAPFPFVDRDALVNAVRLTNAYLIANHGDTYAFATMFAGVLDPDNGRLLYVNAGHNPPLVLSANGRGGRDLREELAPTGPAIGLLPNVNYRLGETTLLPDDLFFAFTDGVTEARNPAAEELSEARLEALLQASDGTAEATLAAVEAAVREHTAEAEAFDDVTMIALRRLSFAD